MNTRLVLDRWNDWLEPGSPSDVRLFHSDSSDRIFVCPSSLGQGYVQEIQLCDDLSLFVLDYTLHQDVMMDVSDESRQLEFEFQLAGSDAGYSFSVPYFGLQELGVKRSRKQFFKIEIVFKRSLLVPYFLALIERLPPQTYYIAEKILQFMYWGHKRGRSSLTIPEMLKQILQSEISLDFLDTLEHIMPDSLYAETIAFKYANRHPITSAMEQIIGQILSCPYQNVNRRTYLKQKVLELVGLRLEAIVHPPLKPEDLNCVYQAASVLRNQCVNPPTVEALARQVCTNRLKLNQGFHLVYGTTPFGYLRDYRLMQARRLLITSELSIAQVAAQVGYTSRSRFATAFRKSIGINPKVFQMQAWECNYTRPFKKMRFGRKTSRARSAIPVI
ncbi:helix-turn-helix transcriptional regulator [Lusitaniella coriacea LEGE 07157]|uniref:Helix-turn-helix transcriptional regulator n=1 Tax=Lusitaniella coriacea LEGE 07157 TaxID=945747 RepID=A0A8J7E0Z7_9CYAN|nr:helix-turn-helix transcriptional regulator [Lusitaniella coriacea]MBE9117326.1 helix-turn-helix transcriptional regulator [Lusitaniella coriacea LEGE 07157]